jgi:hypothetical protein
MPFMRIFLALNIMYLMPFVHFILSFKYHIFNVLYAFHFEF